MKYVACVKDGVVNRVITVDDLAVFQDQNPTWSDFWDAMVETTNDPGGPGPGWIYDGIMFSPPAPVEE